MKVLFISEGKIFCAENGKKYEIPCERISKYKAAISDINRRKEWKNGEGARFTGMMERRVDENSVYAKAVGVTPYGDGLIYALMLDSSVNIYSRSYDPSDTSEGLIISSNDFGTESIAYNGEKLAFSQNFGEESHISVLEPPSADYDEVTEGDSKERSLHFSNCRKDRLYFSTSGNGRDENGFLRAQGPLGGAYADIGTGNMGELLSDDRYDYISLQDDEQGNLYYIRQPYGGEHPDDRVSVGDILLAPFRLLKALGNYLNFMSVMWGGRSLDGKDPEKMLTERARNMAPKDMIIDGNVISAKELAKKDDEDGRSIIPLSRVLIRKTGDEEEVLAKGVLDFHIKGDTLIYSDGRGIYTLENGTKEKVCKAFLAGSLHIV